MTLFTQSINHLFVCCFAFRLRKVRSCIWKRHQWWRASKLKPMLDTDDHWTGRYLYRATSDVILCEESPQFSRFWFWGEGGAPRTFLTRIPTGLKVHPTRIIMTGNLNLLHSRKRRYQWYLTICRLIQKRMIASFQNSVPCPIIILVGWTFIKAEHSGLINVSSFRSCKKLSSMALLYSNSYEYLWSHDAGKNVKQGFDPYIIFIIPVLQLIPRC